MSYTRDFLASCPKSDLIVGSSIGVSIKRGVVEEIGVATPVDKGKKKKIKKELTRNLRLRRVLRVLRLAKVPRKERLLQLISSLLSLRTLGKWTLLRLRKRPAILSSQISE